MCCRLGFYSPFFLTTKSPSNSPHASLHSLSFLPANSLLILTVLLPYYLLFLKRCLGACNQVAWRCSVSSNAHSDAHHTTAPTSINKTDRWTFWNYSREVEVGLQPHQHWRDIWITAEMKESWLMLYSCCFVAPGKAETVRPGVRSWSWWIEWDLLNRTPLGRSMVKRVQSWLWFASFGLMDKDLGKKKKSRRFGRAKVWYVTATKETEGKTIGSNTCMATQSSDPPICPPPQKPSTPHYSSRFFSFSSKSTSLLLSLPTAWAAAGAFHIAVQLAGFLLLLLLPSVSVQSIAHPICSPPLALPPDSPDLRAENSTWVRETEGTEISKTMRKTKLHHKKRQMNTISFAALNSEEEKPRLQFSPTLSLFPQWNMCYVTRFNHLTAYYFSHRASASFSVNEGQCLGMELVSALPCLHSCVWLQPLFITIQRENCVAFRTVGFFIRFSWVPLLQEPNSGWNSF